MSRPTKERTRSDKGNNFITTLTKEIRRCSIQIGTLDNGTNNNLANVYTRGSTLYNRVYARTNDIDLNAFGNFQCSLRASRLATIHYRKGAGNTRTTMRIRRRIIQNGLDVLNNGTMGLLNDGNVSLVRKGQTGLRQGATRNILGVTQTMRDINLNTGSRINIFDVCIRRSHNSLYGLDFRPNTGLFDKKRLNANTSGTSRSLTAIHTTPRGSVARGTPTNLLTMQLSTLFYGGDTRYITSLVRRAKLRTTIQTKSSTINTPNMRTSAKLATFIRTRQRLRLVTMTIRFQQARGKRRERVRSSSTNGNVYGVLLLNTRLNDVIRVPRTTTTTKTYRDAVRQSAIQQEDRRLIRGARNMTLTILGSTRPNFITKNNAKGGRNLAI